MATRDETLAWMIILATIPVGLVGLVAEHTFRVLFGKPILAGVFLIVNGLILYCGEKFRSRASVRADQEIAAQRADALPVSPPEAVPVRVLDDQRAADRAAVPAAGHQAVRQEEISPRPGLRRAAGQRRVRRKRPSSAARRSWPCWRASAGTGSPW